MTLDARLRRLEDALTAGQHQRIEAEHRARLHLLTCLNYGLSRPSLPTAWRVAFEQAGEVMRARSPLPSHQCTCWKLLASAEAEGKLRGLDVERQGPAVELPLSLTDEERRLWARFAPYVSIPAQQEPEYR